MQNTMIGALLGAGLIMAAVAGVPCLAPVYATPLPSGPGAELIAVPVTLADHRQQLLLIDPRQRVVGVYHVDTATGEIALKSVRNVHWDLQLAEFNCAAPLPREIRSLIDQR